jgi:hypothetical protein
MEGKGRVLVIRIMSVELCSTIRNSVLTTVLKNPVLVGHSTPYKELNSTNEMKYQFSSLFSRYISSIFLYLFLP